MLVLLKLAGVVGDHPGDGPARQPQDGGDEEQEQQGGGGEGKEESGGGSNSEGEDGDEAGGHGDPGDEPDQPDGGADLAGVVDVGEGMGGDGRAQELAQGRPALPHVKHQ